MIDFYIYNIHLNWNFISIIPHPELWDPLF